MKDTLSYLFKTRIKDLLESRVFKFLVVGGTGTIIQLASLQIFRIDFAVIVGPKTVWSRILAIYSFVILFLIIFLIAC